MCACCQCDLPPSMMEVDPQVHSWSNDMSLAVDCNGRTGQIVLSAVLDNLGKGAAGAAVQNLRLTAGASEASL